MSDSASPATAPAPWTLTGSGYILLYRLPFDFVARYTRFGTYRGGFSAVMLVDYQTSGVGPYRELLFIPGVVELPGYTGYSISRIYVSTMESVVNGQDNWGIPKELADFSARQIDSHTEQIEVTENGRSLLKITLNSGGIRFPVGGQILPHVAQHWEGQTFVTKLQSSGWARFADVVHVRADEMGFPPLHQFHPLIAVKVTDFTLVFPVPQILTSEKA